MRTPDRARERDDQDPDAEAALSYDDLAEMNHQLLASLQHALSVATEVTGLPVEHFLLPDESLALH